MGTAGGRVLRIFVDHPFATEVCRHPSAVHYLDVSASREMFALIDADGRLSLYKIDLTAGVGVSPSQAQTQAGKADFNPNLDSSQPLTTKLIVPPLATLTSLTTGNASSQRNSKSAASVSVSRGGRTRGEKSELHSSHSNNSSSHFNSSSSPSPPVSFSVPLWQEGAELRCTSVAWNRDLQLDTTFSYTSAEGRLYVRTLNHSTTNGLGFLQFSNEDAPQSATRMQSGLTSGLTGTTTTASNLASSSYSNNNSTNSTTNSNSTTLLLHSQRVAGVAVSFKGAHVHALNFVQAATIDVPPATGLNTTGRWAVDRERSSRST